MIGIKTTLICQHCHKEFEKLISQIDSKTKFNHCSKECFNAEKCINPYYWVRTGAVLSEETKKKIGSANRGRLAGAKNHKHGKGYLIRGRNNPNYNNGDKIAGENNPNWRGGRSFESYDSEFNKKLKEIIRERDNLACCVCGQPQTNFNEKLSIHHLDFDKNNNDYSNLIAVCRSCHTKSNFHPIVREVVNNKIRYLHCCL